MESSPPPSRFQRLRGFVLAAILFLFGDKIVSVGTLLYSAYKCTFANACGEISNLKQDPFFYEFIFILLPVGIAVTATVELLSKKHNPEDNVAVLIGVFIGTLAGILQIIETMVTNVAASELAYRPFFFFAIFFTLVLVPIIATLRMPSARNAIRFATEVAVAILLGGIVAVVTQLVIGGAIMLTRPVIDYDGNHINNAVEQLVFRPIAFVWLGTVWLVVAFAPVRATGTPSWSWLTVYWIFAAGAAAVYPVLTDAQDDTLWMPLPIAYALVAATPILAGVMAGAASGGLVHMKHVRAAIFAYIAAATMLFVGLGQSIQPDLTARLLGALLFGLGGAVVLPTAWVSVRFAERIEAWRQAQLPVEASSVDRSDGVSADPPVS